MHCTRMQGTNRKYLTMHHYWRRTSSPVTSVHQPATPSAAAARVGDWDHLRPAEGVGDEGGGSLRQPGSRVMIPDRLPPPRALPLTNNDESHITRDKCYPLSHHLSEEYPISYYHYQTRDVELHKPKHLYQAAQ